MIIFGESVLSIVPYDSIIRNLAGGAEPRPYKLPRKKGKPIIVSAARSIDGSCSEATSIKFDTSVSGGAYQDAREVTIVWNARPKHRFLPEFRGRKHQTASKHSFLPYLFSCERKDRAAGGASETTTTERAAASDVSYPLCSFLPFQTAN